jgi:hypothetical protein
VAEEQQQENGDVWQELGESLQETFQLLGTTLNYLFPDTSISSTLCRALAASNPVSAC